ncbi:hypothetical protein CFP71_13585 [Amycolatopsis thailandensis]|uniref:Secreted protein n=1 Tax=Amycolatopsis thailandensis TaxID=589330 RepID=A0A229SCE6_9PSEU|nr:HAD domain-containing protein [Amycolatopsis thailandensis]OXM56441.1 hypothetical protein CFP71_13585 [Amycolatopsis thailandensis]
MSHNGLLLIDVDGPLNPYAAKPHRRPPGYETFRRTPGGSWLSGRQARKRKGLRVWLNPAHGRALLDLAADTGLQLIWCTTWLHEANTRIGPAIGLPELPVIEFPHQDLEPDGAGGHHWRRDGSWKWAAASRFAAGRPLAWLDDEHGASHYLRPRTSFDHDRADTPTLLCHCDPRTGLLDSHLDQIRAWAASMSG